LQPPRLLLLFERLHPARQLRVLEAEALSRVRCTGQLALRRLQGGPQPVALAEGAVPVLHQHCIEAIQLHGAAAQGARLLQQGVGSRGVGSKARHGTCGVMHTAQCATGCGSCRRGR
jgi:hypothetical protein